jgi:hypothetical protein
MIGDDDLASFFDPEEFGCTVVLIEHGRAPRSVSGMWGAPVADGRIQRANNVKAAAQVKARPDQRFLQLPNDDVPADLPSTKLVADDAEYSIVDDEPLGRLRTLLTLVPYGDRKARASDGKSHGWLPTKS